MVTAVYVSTNYDNYLKVLERLRQEGYIVEADQYIHYGVKNYIINSNQVEADEIRRMILEMNLE